VHIQPVVSHTARHKEEAQSEQTSKPPTRSSRLNSTPTSRIPNETTRGRQCARRRQKKTISHPISSKCSSHQQTYTRNTQTSPSQTAQASWHPTRAADSHVPPTSPLGHASTSSHNHARQTARFPLPHHTTRALHLHGITRPSPV
jgi:hypothetical protein